ncbi:peptidase family C78-domain-containing protein [Bipolaris maydis]|nr:peptidase family C78-domain-containing protein [Bipolaris maydis]
MPLRKRMPEWLHRQLSAGPEITIVNRIGRDGRIIKHEQTARYSRHIIAILLPFTLEKTPHEGGFCGYRNIHMLLSYIQGAKAQGHEEFPWSTSNHIEGASIFLNAEINCAVEVFFTTEDGKTLAHRTLLAAVERYFAQATTDDGSTVCKTLLPPIYLQQPGHSLTIVGFERHYDGTCHLVVFDPMYHTTPAMHKLLGRKNIKTARPEVLHTLPTRLSLTATPPLFPAWDVLRQFPDCRFVYVFSALAALDTMSILRIIFLQPFRGNSTADCGLVTIARFARAELLLDIRWPLSTTGLPSWGLALDGTANSLTSSSQPTGSGAVFNMGPFSTVLPQPTAVKPYLSLLTEVGRKYPGFPTPLSPTTSAKNLFPSPTSNSSIMSGTPRIPSSAITPASPMSIDGSEMCGPSHRCESHSYEHYGPQFDSIDCILNQQTRSRPRTPSAYHNSIAPRLSYTSNRSVLSGLLAVPPLSEHQVAEYRFWRPCGRRNCGFGCGGQDVGEVAAAKRLFRDVEDVVEEESGEGGAG